MAPHIALHEIGAPFQGRPISFAKKEQLQPAFLALNPEGFSGAKAYGARVAHIADVIGKAKPMKDTPPPRLPGSRGHAVKRKIAAEGIVMFDNLRAALKNVAGMLESPS